MGVTANRLVDEGVHREWIRRKYIDALVRFSGVSAVVIPTGDHDLVSDVMSHLDGLLLTGDESNIHPSRYNGYQRQSGPWDVDRDAAAFAAIDHAVRGKMPILGICRGLQELNVYFGGTLHHDLDGREAGGCRHREDLSLPRDRQYDPVHRVDLKHGGLLASLFDRESLAVNSLHGQGVDVLGIGLQVEAVCREDGLVEAVSVAGSETFQLGVQWHPEWHVRTDVAGQRLFQAFGQACRGTSAWADSQRQLAGSEGYL